VDPRDGLDGCRDSIPGPSFPTQLDDRNEFMIVFHFANRRTGSAQSPGATSTNICGVSVMDLCSSHSCNAQNFEMASRFLENLCTLVIGDP